MTVTFLPPKFKNDRLLTPLSFIKPNPEGRRWQDGLTISSVVVPPDSVDERSTASQCRVLTYLDQVGGNIALEREEPIGRGLIRRSVKALHWSRLTKPNELFI